MAKRKESTHVDVYVNDVELATVGSNSDGNSVYVHLNIPRRSEDAAVDLLRAAGRVMGLEAWHVDALKIMMFDRERLEKLTREFIAAKLVEV